MGSGWQSGRGLRLVRRPLFPQRRNDVGDAVAGMAFVDPITLGGKRAQWRFDGVGGNALSTPPVTIFCVNASRSPCGTK